MHLISMILHYDVPTSTVLCKEWEKSVVHGNELKIFVCKKIAKFFESFISEKQNTIKGVQDSLTLLYFTLLYFTFFPFEQL